MFKKIDEKQKNKVLEFDKQKDSYEVLINKIVVGIFSICLVADALLKGKQMLYGLIFAFFAVNFIVMQYVYTKDRKNNNNRGASVFEIIKYAPIDKDVYIAVRMQYIIKFFFKILLAAFAVKILFIILGETYAVLDFLLTTLIVFVTPVALGYLELRSSLK